MKPVIDFCWRTMMVVLLTMFGSHALTFGDALNRSWQPSNSCSTLNYSLIPNNPYCLIDLDNWPVGDYGYSKWGNLLDRDYSTAGAQLEFNNLTVGDPNIPSSYMNDLLLSDDRTTPTIISFPNDATWTAPTASTIGRISSSQVSHVSLYRKLHFPGRLSDSTQMIGPDAPINSGNTIKKVVILIHGWNPHSNTDSYITDNTPEFKQLVGNLKEALSGSDWKLILYHWERDADTGEKVSPNIVIHGTRSAEIAHQHGQHMGELLATLIPNLEKVHFIAHSAGSWTARSATKYLLQAKPAIKIQVTLLDPFIPDTAFADSSLSVPRMQEINYFLNASADNLFLLENYFSDEGVLGTSNPFHWRGTDITLRVDWGYNPSPIGGTTTGSSCAQRFYCDHSGPIQFYADTVRDTTAPPEQYSSLWQAAYSPLLRIDNSLPGLRNFNDKAVGWRKSMFYQEKVTQGATFSAPAPVSAVITSVSPNSLPGMPLPTRQTLTINGSGFSTGSRLNFYVSSEAYLNRIPTYVSPTELQYNIAVDNVTSNWTVKVLNGTLESNTASFSVTATPDTATPIVAIASPTNSFFYTTATSSITLSGTAVDNVGLASLRWFNHRGGSGSFAASTTWSSPSILLFPGDNVISIFAADAAGNEGSDTIVVTYDSSVPSTLPLAPILQDVSVVLGSYTVTWSAVSGASYVLEEDVTGAFTSPARFNLTSNSLVFTGKQSGTYYYRVLAINASGQGPASSVKTAVVAYNQGPGPIYATSPTDDSTNQPLSVTLGWSASHPGGEGLRFNVYVVPADTDIFYPNNLVARGLTGTSFAVSNLPYNTRVSWGIEVIDDTGDVRFSRMFHFTTVADTSPPTGSISINNGAATTDTYSVTLFPSASDIGSGVQYMRFSNDGTNWSYWNYLAPQFPWNLVDPQYGGRYGLTTYTVYAQFRDNQGNVSPVYFDSIDKVTGTAGNIILNGKFYETIQDAISAANPGETVYLTEGVFTIPTYMDTPNPLRPHDPNRAVGIVLRPGVALKGSGPSKTTINFQDAAFGLVDADNATIEGIDVVNSSIYSGRTTVLLESSSSRIHNCTIRGGYYGIHVGWNSLRPAVNTQISNNLIINNSQGIFFQDSSNVSITHNTIAYNTPYAGVASAAGSTIIRNNIIAFNGYQVGAVTGTTIGNNDVFPSSGNSGYGGIPNQTGINGNISADPLFVNPSAGNYQLSAGSPAVNAGANIGVPFSGSAPDMGAFEQNATGSIQVNSNQAGASFVIVGPQGSYSGSGAAWSSAILPIGLYTISFNSLQNLYSPAYQAIELLSGQALVVTANYSADTTPPVGSIAVNYAEYATDDANASLVLDIEDAVAGMGSGALMKFSNDGVTWSTPEPYSTLKKDWNLAVGYGATNATGIKTAYAMVSDALGNWATFTDAVSYVPNRQVFNVPAQFSTIQAAVNAAQPGDVVQIAPGSFCENVTLLDGVSLRGSGGDKTVFSGCYSIISMATNSQVEGIGGYISVFSNVGPAIIQNNIFSSGAQQIAVTGVGKRIIRNNIFHPTYATPIGTGVIVDGGTGAAEVVVENNTFVNLGTALQLAYTRPTTKVFSRNNIFASNNIAVLDDSAGDTVHKHIFSSFNTYWANIKGNFGELDSWYQTANRYRLMEAGDVNADPLFTNISTADFHLQAASTSINSGNPDARYTDVDLSRNDRGAYGGTSAAPPPAAPLISTEPTSQTVTVGANVTFSVVATGGGPLSYQWQKSGANLLGATGASLILSNVTNADVTGYRVIVSNQSGTQTSLTAYLNINAPLIDLLPLALSITSPTNNDVVTTGSITITGTASDAGQGDSGVSFVTINGMPALGGTAIGGGLANWSLSIPLSSGTNLISVTATDGSANANQTTQNITVTYNSPVVDTDGDGIPDDVDLDDDNDGMSDNYELAHGTNPLLNDANGDLDGDGFTNGQEHAAGSNPGSNASIPDGANGVAYVLFRDHFDDLQYDDRWYPDSIAPDAIYSLNENGTLLQGTMQRPVSGCRRVQFLSFATVGSENAVYLAKLRMNGGGALIYGLMQGVDVNNQIEVRLQEVTPYLRILSWEQAVLTDAPAMVPTDYRNKDLNVRIVKTGTLYQIFVNHILQGALPNTGITNAGLRPFLALENCAVDGTNADSQFDLVEVLIDRDGDGLADLHEDKNKNGVVDAGESDPLNPDTDGDTVPDGFDNCLLVPNANPRDTDNDGYGNRCDADFDNNGFVNFADQNYFKSKFGTTDPRADLDGNGFVNFADQNIFKSLFGKPPGPSGLAP